eukprot:s2414_g3.t1
MSLYSKIRAQGLTSPDAMYPPPPREFNKEPAMYPADGWTSIYGSNTPVLKRPDPLPPVDSVFYFRVLGKAEKYSVFSKPSEDSSCIGQKQHGEVVRIVDFQGAWVEERWEGWMLAETVEETLLDEIDDPVEHEKEFTKELFRRVWKINEHLVTRLRDRSEKALQYMNAGRLPPGKKALLPEGTRCVNAFWGLEARHIPLAEGEEYWPQGCLTLSDGYLKSGWEQPSEEGRSGHWRVFAARPFEANELVEVCPLVEVDLETCIACFQLRMNVVETPADEDSVPLGYGMLYQQSIELPDVQINWTPVTNFNCKFIPVGNHMYIYATRRIQADEELILEYKRNFRTEEGEAINFEGFTPYWCRQEQPDAFRKALVAPCGPRKVRPIPGCVKFGKSQLHGRGVFADANFKRGEVVEVCPCLILDTNGADCMQDGKLTFPMIIRGNQDHCFQINEVKLDVEGKSVVKRQSRYVLPCGYGGMYNHLERGQGENVQWFYDETTQCCIWVAHPKDGVDQIQRNEELCFDYGEAYWEAPRRVQRPKARVAEAGA